MNYNGTQWRWICAKQAVDEYFASQKLKPF
jgi:hypothetical protein